MPSELTSSIGRFGLIAAGGYAFGPIGAAVGALLGGFLFGSSGPKIEGPRLGDLDVSSSTYGGVIPLGFGVQKVAGAMIWATDIDEDKSTRREGGGLFGGVRSNRRQAAHAEQQAAAQQQYEAQVAQLNQTYNRALAACLQGRGYTVN